MRRALSLRSARWDASARGTLSALCVMLMLQACTAGNLQPSSPPTAALGSTPSGATASGVTATTANASAPAVGPACGYQNTGKLVHVAENIDVCLPATTCTAEVCPKDLGTCVDGLCVMKSGYKGVQTLPQGWTTYYCQLSTGGCDGVTQVEKPIVTAQKLGKQLGLPLCEGAPAGAECVGIAASSPMMVGNSQIATDVRTGALVRPYGLGLSEASNICYKLVGPGGTAYVPLTDRCGGYCKCGGSGYKECGDCVNATDMTPNCPCVGSAPGLADACCGAECPVPALACDWCASNNHPHFDVDQDTFNHICGDQKTRGSCQLSTIAPIVCPMGVTWPPP